jgi:cytochrome c oxidase subunit 2
MTRSVLPFALSLEDASTFAPRENALFTTLLVASLIVVTGLAVANGFFLVRYRRGSKADRTASGIATWKVEATWITLTTVIFLGFFAWGARLYVDLERAPANATQVHVIGRQWMWDTRYANGKREFDALHVEVGRPVQLLLSSEDVIHSLFVPAFRIKQDVVPGKLTSTWFTPTKPGDYALYCTQYCGSAHSQMTGHVVVMESAAFAAWAATAASDGDLAIAGEKIFARGGCSSCHGGNGGAAPSLAGIYGRVDRLADGTYRRVDESYLHDAIMEPNLHPLAGYAPVMPSYAKTLKESDVIALIAYLKTLPPPAPNPGSPSVP